MICSGHRAADIANYTLAQFRRYLAAVQRREQAFFKQAIMSGRIAQADGDGFKKIMRELG